MWLEAGKPNAGFIFDIMKRTRHQYHYAVRRCKKNRINIQKQKLAENISDSKQFRKELKKISPANKIVTRCMSFH